jgi:peptide/nickel transport system substrate-binding protein
MRSVREVALLGLALWVSSVGCAQSVATREAASQQSFAPASAAPPSRITIATFRELDFTPYSATPGTYELRNMVNPGLSVLDDRGTLRPVLAESVPTLENGLWKVSPDGRMETTWKIRPEAVWHDGTPLTSDDLAFTVQVGRDRATGVFSQTAYSSVDEVTTPDPRTIVLTWRQPYVDADQMFTIWLGWPIPKHSLEAAYLQDSASLSQIPFWSHGYVGSGPYRLREYDPGRRIILEAFESFLLGRPRIGEIEVAYTPDANTVMANLLAGTADLTVGIGFSVDAAIDLRDRWRDGRLSIEFSDQRWFRLDPQFIDPVVPAITDLRFRRALLHAIDRQEMVDSLEAGLSRVAHTFMAPDQPEYAGIEGRVRKYEYDSRRAVDMLQELGYRRGTDGLIRDAAGRPLELDIVGSNQAVTRTMLAAADYWQRVGITTSTSIVPPQRSNDWPWRATFPGFALFTGTHDVSAIPALRSNQARTAENNYEVAGLPNWPRYRNAELDDLVDRFHRTIPRTERIEVLTQINQHIFENLNTIPLYYFPNPYAIANRVVNVPTGRAARASMTWNVQLWEARG